MHFSRCTLLLAVLWLAPAAARADLAVPPDFRPDPKAVQRHGPAYRYPQAGWIILHIEGAPYERGYQHGRLLAAEIAAHLRCFAAVQTPKAPEEAWKHTRLLVNALFLRRFHKEFLEEMKGIADGAAAGGAKFDKRPLDLVDIVALNCWAEVESLSSALEALPTGLEGMRFPKAKPKAMPAPKPMHCSAFAATGPATADGKIVFGHITMFDLYPSNFYNVWLDVKPAKGHRILMQSYPGGIQSGMDYYLNDAGLLICETTIDQTRFHAAGLSVATRIRQAAQYADSIDKAVEILKTDNNGLYTNEWLLADIKTNEIAMFELGTHKSKLWRSSKNEWFGGTPGFYWGCNNTKDLDVRLETLASPVAQPENLVWHPSERDQAWQRLYAEHKGKIDASFGKRAFTTPPVASYHALDAKFTTTDLAKQLRTWALYGPPLGRTWQPTHELRQQFPEIKPLVSNPWTVLHPHAPAKADEKAAAAVDLETPADGAKTEEKEDDPATAPAWHGTLLPKTAADVWLAAAFAEYQKIVALENALRERCEKDDPGKGELTPADRDRLAVELFAHRSGYLMAARTRGDVPLAQIRSEYGRDEWYRIASGKGILFLHALRKEMGATRFQEAMDSFGRQHGGTAVTTAQFQSHMKHASITTLDELFKTWLHQPGLPCSKPNDGPFSVLAFGSGLSQTLIVYGSADETPTNREAAEALQQSIREHFANVTVPIKADRDVTDEELKTRHLLLIGRSDTNRLVERFRAALPIDFGSRSFVVRGKSYAHPGSAVFVAAENPANQRCALVVIAGLSAEATLRAVPKLVESKPAEAIVLPNSGAAQALVLPAKELVPALGTGRN